MKKITKFFVLFCFACCLTGCKKEVVEEPIVEDVIEDIEVKVEEKQLNKVSNEPTEAELLYEEKVAQLNKFYYYYYSLEGNTIKGSIEYMEEEINAQNLVNVSLKQFTDRKVLVESLNIEKVDDTFIGYLNLDSSFQEVLNSQTTPLMQWYIIQTLTNTLCNNLIIEDLQILSGGNPLHTLYKNYQSEDFLRFETLVYDNLHLFDKEVVEICRSIEFLRRSGYEITQQQYLEIINSGIDLSTFIPSSEDTSDEFVEDEYYEIENEYYEEDFETEEVIEEEVIEDVLDDSEIEEDSFNESDEVDEVENEDIIIIG